MASNPTAKTLKEIVLSTPNDWFPWIEYIQSIVDPELWPYFDPDGDEEYHRPEMPPRPIIQTNSPASAPVPTPFSTTSTQTAGVTTRANLAAIAAAAAAAASSSSLAVPPPPTAAQEKEHQKNLDYYYKDFAIYKEFERKWERYRDAELKLRNRIHETVNVNKSAALLARKSVREWLITLRSSTAPSKAIYKQSIRTEYIRLMHNGFDIWPPGGPADWLAKWETLMVRSETHHEPIPNWLDDVVLVWVKVPELMVYFRTIEIEIQKETADYQYSDISAVITREWERRKQGLTLRYNKPKATRGAFSATFSGQEAPQAEDEEAAEKAPGTGGGRGKGRRQPPRGRYGGIRSSRSRSPKGAQQRSRSRDPCRGCGGPSHVFISCFLVRGIEKPWISEAARRKFGDNMRNESFRKEVEEFRRRSNAN